MLDALIPGMREAQGTLSIAHRSGSHVLDFYPAQFCMSYDGEEREIQRGKQSEKHSETYDQ